MGLRIADVELESRFFQGTAGYPSPQVLQDAIAASVTTSVPEAAIASCSTWGEG